ncbi:MAG: hypothetical protein WC760_08665 [Bacteroidia bacterium]|jgi:DNA anti-recombination protein RmuC
MIQSRTGSFIAVILIATTIGCSSGEQKVENASKDLQDAKTELREEKRDSVASFIAFKQESEARILENEKSIEAYKTRMKTAGKKIKESDQKMIDNLQQSNIDMRKRIEEYKEQGEDSWTKFKDEFNHDLEQLAVAINDITVDNTK